MTSIDCLFIADNKYSLLWGNFQLTQISRSFLCSIEFSSRASNGHDCSSGLQTTQGHSLNNSAFQTSHLKAHTSNLIFTTHIHTSHHTSTSLAQTFKFLTCNFRFHTSHIKTHILQLTPHTRYAISLTSYLKRLTGKLARIVWQGDDATWPWLREP